MKTLQRICIMCTVALTVAVMLYWWLHFHWDGGPAIQPPPRIGSQALGEPKPAGGPIETPTPEPPRPHGRDKPAPAQEQAFMAAFQTPISFWGKVIDEKGNEIPDVAVELVANDEPYGKGAKYQRNTDSSGLFSIGGIHGMSLHVRVSKDGYYQTAESQKSTIYATRGHERPGGANVGKAGNFSFEKEGRHGSTSP